MFDLGEAARVTHGSLFSGIGGFDYAASLLGWENAFHCEINPFGRHVLNYYWPNATSYEDITKTDFSIWRERIDIVSGGFPCQPFSLAGKRKGKEDDRYLWPEMLRAIDEIRPRWVCGENVAGIVSMVQPEAGRATVESTADFFGEEDSQVITEYQEYVIETVCNDLERIGYSVQPVIIPACAVGAPHRRDRIWFIANAKGERMHREKGIIRETERGQVGELLSNPDKPGIGYVGQETFAYPVSRYDGGTPGRHEGASGTEWLQERDEVREPGESGDVLGPSTDTCGVQPERKRRLGEMGIPSTEGESVREEREWVRYAAGGGCEVGNAAEPNSPGWQELDFPGLAARPGHGTRSNHEGGSDWENFPTQPPICSGNDGLPSQLAGITVSKHRNESIKAYGNAIVPQVALEIFQAIQQQER